MTKRPAVRKRRLLTFTLSVPQTLVMLVVLGALMSWSAAVTGYIVFKDDVLLQFAMRHKAMQDDYEDRIVELRRSMEEIRTASLAEKAQLSAKLDALIHLQAELQEQQAAVAALVGVAPTSPLKHDAGASALPKPRPMGGDAPEKQTLSQTRDRGPFVTGSIGAWRSPTRSIASRFDSAETGYQRLEAQQENLLATLETRSNVEKTSLAMVYSQIGVTPTDDQAPRGGPFIEPPAGDQSDQRIARIKLARAEIEGLRSGLNTLPIAMPAKVGNVTSDFGMRPDPFLGRLAFHSGIDFRAASGTPVRSTASGRVAEAGRNGGYGLMVEVAHQHGLATRYAHLSSIAVQEGALIDAGQIIGYVGSTGRSTGPHLHYETRRKGEPVNPTAFIEAGRMAMTIEP